MLLKLIDAARYLAMSVKRLRGMIKRGEIRFVPDGKCWKVRSEDLDLWIARRTRVLNQYEELQGGKTSLGGKAS